MYGRPISEPRQVRPASCPDRSCDHAFMVWLKAGQSVVFSAGKGDTGMQSQPGGLRVAMMNGAWVNDIDRLARDQATGSLSTHS